MEEPHHTPEPEPLPVSKMRLEELRVGDLVRLDDDLQARIINKGADAMTLHTIGTKRNTSGKHRWLFKKDAVGGFCNLCGVQFKVIRAKGRSMTIMKVDA